nr:ABC transporter ATP-binding protein [Eubacterium sp.]
MDCVIKVQNLSKSFKDKIVLENLEFQIEKGEMVAITGKSGRGKSTLLNILGLISEKSAGDMWLFEHKNVKAHSRQAMMLRRDKIGYLFQNYGLVEEETVLWNLKLALEYKKLKASEKKKKISKALSYVGLGGFENHCVYKLSGGEQQRVAMARILLQDCELILADEPTGSLDIENRDVVMNILSEMKKRGKTIVIVTHDSYVAEQCDRIIDL